MAKQTEDKKKNGLFLRFVKMVEAGGNKLPHPVFLYVGLIVVVMIISLICSKAGVSITYDALDRTTGVITQATVEPVNLFSKESLQNLIANLVNAYDQNAVLPAILIVAMFITVAEKSGFFSAALRKVCLGAPRAVTTYVLSVVGVCCNIMSDAGQVLGASLGGVVFSAIGRNPWIGIMVGFGSAAAGYTANLLPANTDVLTATITNYLSEPLGMPVSPLCNWYYLIVSTFIIAGVITLIAETFLVKLFGDRKAGERSLTGGANEYALTAEENRGLKFSMIALGVFVVALLALTVPKNGFFRNADGTLLPKSPLISSLVPLICCMFLVLGVSFGIGAGTITKAKQIPEMMTEGVRGLAGLATCFFPLAVLMYAFSMSNLSTIIAIAGERFLRSIGLTGLPLLCLFAFIMGAMSLVMYGGAARWAIFAPIFVPMFMNLGLKPDAIQLAYRIGDSFTANIMPLNACVMVALSQMQLQRDPELNPQEAGMGTLISAQLPISIATYLVMALLLCIFVTLGIPLGPG